MKKALSLFLAFIIAFGVVAVGITEAPHTHAEEAVSQKLTENNFVYEVENGKAIIVDYTDKQSTDEIIIPDTLGGYSVTELAAESFKGCQCIAITIPESVINIDHEAFAYDMPNIERFTVAEGNGNYYSDEDGVIYSNLSYIGYPYLFAYPKNAPAETYVVQFGSIATFIGAYAFSEAGNLKEVEIRGPVASGFDSYAFYNAKKLEKINSSNLWAIGDYAFAGCSSLADINLDISGPIQWLGWDAFEGTAFINNPDNYDEDGVLYYGDNLIATFPEADKVYYEIKPGTISVAGGAFKWDSLKEVYIPSSVNFIYANPFALCGSLEKFTVQAGGSLRTDKNGVLEKSGTLLAYPNGIYQTCYVVGSGIEQINSYAFYLSPIKNFYIPASVDLAMGYLALGGDGVTDIHFEGTAGQWESCRHPKESYEKITAAEDAAKIHFNDYSASEHKATVNNEMRASCSCGYTAEYTLGEGDFFENGFSYNVVDGKAEIVSCTKTTTKMIVIPETLGGYDVTRILDKAFVSCNCTAIVIPATLRDFGLGAFWALKSLQKITVSPDNVYYSSDNNGILYNADKTELLLYPKNATATTHTVADTVREIAPYAFYSATNLDEITITSNVEKIGDFSFENASITKLIIENGVKSVGNRAFYSCDELENVTLSDTLEYIGYESFEGTKFIANKSNYDSNGVFYYGNYLLRTTDGESHAGFTKVGYIVKDGTKLIANSAIHWTGLESIAIPASVEFIGGSAFSEATSLKTISVSGSNFRIDNYGVLYNFDKTKLVAYPVGLGNICYGIPRGVTEIGEWAFHNVQILECVNIPLSVTAIGEFAFGMSDFESITHIRYEGTRNGWEEINIAESSSGWISYEKSLTKVFNTYSDGVHTIASHTIKKPTCTWYGNEYYTCTCGYNYTITIPSPGHIPEAEYRVIDEPRCETQGQLKLYCSVCEKELDKKSVPALSHDKKFVEYLEPTCDLPGGSLYKCKRCEADVFEEEEPPVDHDKEFIEYIEPTCDFPGGSHYRCTMCEEGFWIEEEPALEHIPTAETVVIEPTCTTKGGLYHVCERCSEPIYSECIDVYPATGHTEGEWKCIQEATCTTRKIEVLYCETCKKEISRSTGTYGTHNYIGYIVEQTCSRITTHYICSSCGDDYFDEVRGNDIGHITEKVFEEPTCTETGKSYEKCTVCGKAVGEVTEADSLGHTWSDTVTKEATCSEEGLKSTTCTVCGEKDEIIIPQIAHTFGKWEYESGNTFSGVCSVCGEDFDSLEVELSFNESKVTLYNKTSKNLSVTVTGNISDNIIYTSSDSSVVLVDSNGKITAKAPGHAFITARLAGTDIMARCDVTVTPRNFGIEWIVDGETFDYSFVEEGTSIVVPEAPEKSGFVFVDWSPKVPETMPSASLSFTAVYNIVSQSAGYDVSATYSVDAFNEPVSLDVKTIEGEREPGGVYMVDGQSYNQVGLYNIKAVNSESTVVQPNEGHKVTIKLALPAAYANRKNFVIYHRFVDGTREQLSTAKGTLIVENGYLIFEVSSFSEFEVLAVSSSIKITNLPAKTVYACGEEIELAGISVIYTGTDGTKKVITRTDYLTVSGYDSSEVGTQTVTVRYGNNSDTFEVTVRYTFWQWLIKILTFGLFKF